MAEEGMLPTVMSPEPTLKSALLTTAVGWMRRRAVPVDQVLVHLHMGLGAGLLRSCSASAWQTGSRNQRLSSSRATRRSVSTSAPLFLAVPAG